MPLDQKEQRPSQQLFSSANYSLYYILVLSYITITVEYNEIGPGGAKAIAPAIQQCKALTTLHIGIILHENK